MDVHHADCEIDNRPTGPGRQTRSQYEADRTRKRELKTFGEVLAAQQRRITRRLLSPKRNRHHALGLRRTSEILALIHRPGIINYAHASGERHPRLDQLDRSPQD